MLYKQWQKIYSREYYNTFELMVCTRCIEILSVFFQCMVDKGIKVSRLSYNKQQDIDVVYLE